MLSSNEFNLLISFTIYFFSYRARLPYYFLGLYLKRTQRINDNFIGIASKLFFNICLPILLFLAIINSQVNLIAQSSLALFYACAAIISFLIFWWIAPLFSNSPEDKEWQKVHFTVTLPLLGSLYAPMPLVKLG